MNSASQNLNYLTVDSIDWAKGYERPRMSQEEKRAKHRVHQRNFVLRQREQLNQLRRELRCHKLQLLRLQAVQEADSLAKENASLREKLNSDSLPKRPANQPGLWDLFPSEPENMPKTPNSSVVDQGNAAEDEDNSMLHELMALLTEVKSDNVNSDTSDLSCQCEVSDLIPLTWSPTTASALAGFSW
jgi:hypothetical protein